MKPLALMTYLGKTKYVIPSKTSWLSKQNCIWATHYFEIKFAQPIILSLFSFESSVGKQPTSYRFHGGRCEGDKYLLKHFDKDNLSFSAEIESKKHFATYCFEVFNVSGYSPSVPRLSRHVQQKTVSMNDLAFWKCKPV